MYIGEIAAVLVALCWALVSMFFAAAVKEVGSMIVNRVRLTLAVLLLALIHLLLVGSLVPLQAGLDRWFWLGTSGIIGLVLGDAVLLIALGLVGPRLATLTMASVPIISTLIAWVFLGEMLNMVEILGIVIAVAGISVVIMDRRNGGQTEKDRRRYALGILAGFGGALGQAVGLVLAKKGLEGNFPAISGVLIRMIIAMIVMWGHALLVGQVRCTITSVIRNHRAMKYTALGAVFGPVIGVWLSMVAVQSAYVGIASTLMALTPIIMLPIVRVVYKEQISKIAISGTLITLSGVAVILIFS
jgi:drug/metabolite transporter (DMT)-like permease